MMVRVVRFFKKVFRMIVPLSLAEKERIEKRLIEIEDAVIELYVALLERSRQEGVEHHRTAVKDDKKLEEWVAKRRYEE